MRFLLLMIAAVVAVFAGIAAMQLSSPAPTQTAATAVQATGSGNVATVDILVARTPIPPGTLITQGMIDKQPWPENLVLDTFILANGPNANIAGKVARTVIQAREPILSNKLASTTDSGFLAASLPRGMRAITIPTDAITGVAGFVFPGDRVDLLFTHNIPEDLRSAAAASQPQGPAAGAGAAEKPAFTEVLAANIPVLAINIRNNSGEENTGNAIPSPTASVVPSSMTLQVTDMLAEKIRLAEKVGTLSIALRSIHDRAPGNVPAPADLMSLTQLSMEQAAPEEETIKVIRSGDFSASSSGTNVQGRAR